MAHSHSTARSSLALTVLRVAVGATLAAHGTQKLFGWFGGGGVSGTAEGMHAMGFRPARQHAVLAGLGEAGAGTALALGLGTPIAGAGAAITMGTAASIHTPNGFFNADGGFEFPGFLGLTAATFALGGPGPASLDHATGHVFDRNWMRALALAAIPFVVGMQVRRRKAALAADAAAPQPDEQAPDAAGSTEPAPSADADPDATSGSEATPDAAAAPDGEAAGEAAGEATTEGSAEQVEPAKPASTSKPRAKPASEKPAAAKKPASAKPAPAKPATAKPATAKPADGGSSVPTPAEVVATSPTLAEHAADDALPTDDTSSPSPDAV